GVRQQERPARHRGDEGALAGGEETRERRPRGPPAEVCDPAPERGDERNPEHEVRARVVRSEHGSKLYGRYSAPRAALIPPMSPPEPRRTYAMPTAAIAPTVVPRTYSE